MTLVNAKIVEIRILHILKKSGELSHLKLCSIYCGDPKAKTSQIPLKRHIDSLLANGYIVETTGNIKVNRSFNLSHPDSLDTYLEYELRLRK